MLFYFPLPVFPGALMEFLSWIREVSSKLTFLNSMEFVFRSFPEKKLFVDGACKGLFQTFVASKHVHGFCTMSSSVSGIEAFVLKVISINIPANTVYVCSLSCI